MPASMPSPAAPPREASYDLVVIGASAGGLAALRHLVDRLPRDFPVRVVAMLHLPPGAEPESVLQRLPLRAERLRHGQDLATGRVWVCPPRCFVELLPDGTCAVSENPQGALALPIDRLLASAARSFGARAIGVILSGMGSDGAAGARDLHAAGARVLVQAPGSAEYADMPSAAIATGAIDLIVPLGDIGEVVAEFVEGAPRQKARTELRAIEGTFGAADGRGGTVSDAARAVDWQRTAPGAVLAWPDQLRWLVQDALAAPYAVSIWWGPSLAALYNDALRPLLGTRHPHALGRSARETWAAEWARIGPLVDRALHEGQPGVDDALPIVVPQAGGTRQAFVHAFFAPLRDAAGRVLGLRCTMWETTRSVVVQRRLRLAQALSTAMAGASTRLQACTLAAEALATERAELPFALLYLVEKPPAQATLAAATGLAAGSLAAPRVIHPDGDPSSGWPLAWALREAQPSPAPWIVESLDDRFPGLAASVDFAALDPRPERAVLVPLQVAPTGGTRAVLVLGLAPGRTWDDACARFVETLGQQLAAGLGDARAKELERERLEHLTALDEAKNEFFSNVSHEFRTPLTLLLAPLEELARDHEALAPRLAAELDVASRNARRLLRLVNNLLDFSQIETRGRHALVAPADLGLLTTDVASAFRSAIESAGLALRLEVAADLPPVPVNAAMWEQVVSNLVSNAFKFTFEGSITVRLKALRLHAELEVADTGIGIPAHELPHIFKRFHRVHGARARTVEGAGIGLALVQDFVNRMGGQLTVRSTEGVGSTFRVWLPMKAQPLRQDPGGAGSGMRQPGLVVDLAGEASRWADDAAPREVVEDMLELPPAPAQEAGHAAPRARVLVVDDNADLRDYLRRLLSSQWQVTLAAHGEQALALAREQVPDLVLADVMMPAMGGFQLLQQMRADTKLAHVPVLLLTARAGEESAIEGLRAGADDYVAKPFSPRELMARLQAALDRARAAAALRESETKFRAVFETMIEACCVFDMIYGDLGQPVDWRILDANPGYERQSGLKDVAGKLASEVMPGTEPYWIETFARVLETGVAEQIERWHQPTDRWIHSSTARVGAAGSRRLVSVFYDITERKRAEIALRAGEEKYRQLFERIDEGFCIIEVIFEGETARDYRFIDVNPSFERHTGIVNARGRSMREIAPDHEAYWFERYGQVALTGQAQRFEAGAKALGDRWYEVNAFRVGEPAQRRVAIVFKDATQRRRSAAALRASEERLRQQNEALQLAARGAPLEQSLRVLAGIVTAATAGEARTTFFVTESDGAPPQPVQGAGDMRDAGLDGDDRAAWSFPIKTREGQVVGRFAMYLRVPREATSEDLALADSVTQTAAVLIASHREARQRERAAEALRQSEATYRARFGPLGGP